jgi:pseudaminic acid cytidylyltransferase
VRVAIIPARGGSKRIPRKNIKYFVDKPMIAYAIEVAKNSGLFDRVIISTDDPEIAEISIQWGGEAPFLRPPNLSDDFTPTVPVIANAIDSCISLGWSLNEVCCIYPCVPLLQVEDIKGAYKLFLASDRDYCFPVVEFPSAIQRALALDLKKQIRPLYPQCELTRTQDLEPVFYDAGQFYWGSVYSWMNNQHLHRSAVGYALPNWRVVDIDTLDDWYHCELLYQSIFKK